MTRQRRVGRKRRFLQKIGLMGFVGLFLVSAGLRLGAIGLASASVSPQQEVPHAPTHGEDMADQCVPADLLETALERVEGRAETLDAREASLNARAAALAGLEAELTARLTVLEDAEARLESLLALSDTAAESDLARLTQVYQSMDAGDAAALFSRMDPGFAAGFLGRMQAEAAAGIMAELDPGVAYSISVLLATRNASAPTSPPPSDPAH